MANKVELECDYCDHIGTDVKLIGEDKVCPSCIFKGTKKDVVKPPININEVLTKSRDVDNRVQVMTDLFNATTVSIVELKKAIDEDETITNKPYTLATELHARYMKHREIIFHKNQEIVEETNKQRAIQIYLNGLSNQLRVEEREKLKIQDINYKPTAVKFPVTSKTIKSSKKRIDKKELRDAAAKLGIAEFTLQMIIIQKNLTVDQAYQMMKKNIDAAKASIPAVVQNSDQN